MAPLLEVLPERCDDVPPLLEVRPSWEGNDEYRHDLTPLQQRRNLGALDDRGGDESIPNLVHVVNVWRGKAGVQYLDYLGRTVPW